MPERNCSKCSVAEQRSRGCHAPPVHPTIILGEKVDRCPKRPVFESPADFGYWLTLYREYRKGNYPEPGSYLEQAAVVIRVFQLMDAVYGEIQQHREDENRRKQWKNGQGAQGSGRPMISSRG